MQWSKGVISTLIILVALLVLDTAKCIATRPKPYLSETYVVDDGGGKTHVVTENYYDQKNSLALEPREYALVMFASVAMLAIASNFARRSARLSALRSRCTAPVFAVVSSVRSGRADDHVRYRQMMYNPTYRYEYLGLPYESNNGCYGRRKYSLLGRINIGDEEEILVNPEKPYELFDFIAQDTIASSRFLVYMLSGMGVMFLVWLLFR